MNSTARCPQLLQKARDVMKKVCMGAQTAKRTGIVGGITHDRAVYSSAQGSLVYALQ